VQPLHLGQKFIDEYRPKIMALSTMPHIDSAVGLGRVLQPIPAFARRPVEINRNKRNKIEYWWRNAVIPKGEDI